MLGVQVAEGTGAGLFSGFLDEGSEKLDPYTSTGGVAQSCSYPFAIAESKSSKGNIVEAEHQTGLSLIKMLYKLQRLAHEDMKLPVMTMTLVGPTYTIYLGSSGSGPSDKSRFYMKQIWSGSLSTVQGCIEFHALLYRYCTWVRDVFRPTVIQALEMFD